MGSSRRRAALRRVPGRRAAGQPHRRAQRDRVLRVRATHAGVRRSDRREPDPPDMLDVVARARELDAFASQHDAQLAVHLHARGAAWSVGYIQQHARRHGFVPGVVAGPAGLSVDGGGRAAGAGADLRLAGRARRRARSRRGARRHAQPRRAADRRERASRSRPGRRPRRRSPSAWTRPSSTTTAGRSAARGFEAIGAELGALYAALDARDLAAGSPPARRLFS